jgi:integrase
VGWIKDNPIKRIEILYDHTAATKVPGIVSVEQAAKLLELAPAHLLPAIAIGLFAGIRPAEIHRLEWSNVLWEDREIYVPAAKSKTAQRRNVTMPENLLEWLAPYRNATGHIMAQRERKTSREISAIARVAGIAQWPKDALRHSFGSYHLAAHKNSPLTSKEMGHMTTSMVFNRYNNLRTNKEALSFFAIRPVCESEKIVAMTQAV